MLCFGPNRPSMIKLQQICCHKDESDKMSFNINNQTQQPTGFSVQQGAARG